MTAATSSTSRVESLLETGSRRVLLTLSRRRYLGTLAARTPLTKPLVARFVAGESLDQALKSIAVLRAGGYGTTADILGESVSTVAEASAAADNYLGLLGALAEHDLDRNVSLKPTQFGLELSKDVARSNLERVVRRAAELDAFVRVDMEDHTATDDTLELVRDLRAIHPSVGIVIQSMLRRSEADVERLIEEKTPVRLCKGAYREPENVAYQAREEVDASYLRIMERLLVAGTRPAIATHDLKMVRAAIAVARKNNIAPDAFEFQMLYGVRRELQERIIAEGWRLRLYVPYGVSWYPYTMRRMAERPANVIFALRSIAGEIPSLISEARSGKR
jgi:proline dehydrogenase